VSTQPADVDPLFPAGVVIGVHGLRGDLKVRPLSGDSTSLETVKEITLQRATRRSLHQVQKASRHKGNLLIRLEGVTSVEGAEEFIGCEVLISHDALAALPEDEFYWFQLEGLRVRRLVSSLKGGTRGFANRIEFARCHPHTRKNISQPANPYSHY
jgi:16S rRNA processing protein RimM